MEASESKDFKEKAIRSLKQGLNRIWKRRTVTITEYDPSYKVVYLGNVLTGWAKGEGCTDKPLCTLWKNYTSSAKPDVHMKVTVSQAGLKAITKEHGLTEYWAHRITFCQAPTNYSKVFCWVYRHEGRKLKQELRCHAVLCSKESTARRMVTQLNSRLAQALTEFKRDKISRQNARLSLANSVYDNPSLPRRKILLSTGSHNYRPPLERSKSAPKLMSIEESLEEEEENCGDTRKSIRRTRTNMREEAFKKARRSSCGGLSEHLKKISTSSLHKSIVGEGDISSFSRDSFLNGDSNAGNETCQDLDDTVLNNPSGGHDSETGHPPVKMKRSLSLQSYIEDDDVTTDGEADDSASRVFSLSEDELDTISRISEEEYLEDSTFKEEISKTVVDDEFTRSEENDSSRFYWGLTEEENLQRERVSEDKTELDLDSLSLGSSRYNSLVRDRKKMFENTQESKGSDKIPEKDSSRAGLLVQNRRKLFENILNPKYNPEYNDISALTFQDISNQAVLDLDPLNRPRDKQCMYLEEESTPSLQSISSGSDTSRVSDFRVCGIKPNYDLDSLSEEDSDESGYVESVPTEGDDKARDLPHHQLMKSCILTPTQCVQV